MALVNELSQRIRDRSTGAYTPPDAHHGIPVGSIVSTLIILGGLGVIVWFLLGERAPRCPICLKSMRLLDEKQDDAYLSPSQLTEERLGSIDYRVWRCDKCQTLEIRKRTQWVSGYEVCPKCNGRTLKTTSRVVREPTYRRTGLELIRKVCKNPKCDYEEEQQRTLPRRERSPNVVVFGGGSGRGGGWFGGSSSGGWSGGGGGFGGGSFGGGSSGGGGAGASW